MKRILIIAAAVASIAGSSGTWALHNTPTTPSAVSALVTPAAEVVAPVASVFSTPAAEAAAPPVACGYCDGGGYLECNAEHLWWRNAAGQYCIIQYYPGWPWSGYAWV